MTQWIQDLMTAQKDSKSTQRSLRFLMALNIKVQSPAIIPNENFIVWSTKMVTQRNCITVKSKNCRRNGHCIKSEGKRKGEEQDKLKLTILTNLRLLKRINPSTAIILLHYLLTTLNLLLQFVTHILNLTILLYQLK